MNPVFSKTLRVAVRGAVIGLASAFLALVAFGLGSPGKPGLGSLFRWFSSPVARFVGWLAKRRIVAADNISVGMILFFVYWILLGVVIALVGYSVSCLVVKRRDASEH